MIQVARIIGTGIFAFIKKLGKIMKRLLKHFTILNIVTSFITLLLVTILKYLGLPSIILQYLIESPSIIHEYFISGVIGIIIRLVIKGIVEYISEIYPQNNTITIGDFNSAESVQSQESTSILVPYHSMENTNNNSHSAQNPTGSSGSSGNSNNKYPIPAGSSLSKSPQNPVRISQLIGLKKSEFPQAPADSPSQYPKYVNPADLMLSPQPAPSLSKSNLCGKSQITKSEIISLINKSKSAVLRKVAEAQSESQEITMFTKGQSNFPILEVIDKYNSPETSDQPVSQPSSASLGQSNSTDWSSHNCVNEDFKVINGRVHVSNVGNIRGFYSNGAPDISPESKQLAKKVLDVLEYQKKYYGEHYKYKTQINVPKFDDQTQVWFTEFMESIYPNRNPLLYYNSVVVRKKLHEFSLTGRFEPIY